jgi:hypothetical protein
VKVIFLSGQRDAWQAHGPPSYPYSSKRRHIKLLAATGPILYHAMIALAMSEPGSGLTSRQPASIILSLPLPVVPVLTPAFH